MSSETKGSTEAPAEKVKRPQPAGLAAANEARKLKSATKDKAVETNVEEPVDSTSSNLDVILVLNLRVDETSLSLKGNDAILKNGFLTEEGSDKSKKVNGYNVFAKEDKDKEVSVGMVRKQLPAILDLLAHNNQEQLTVLAGSPAQLNKFLGGRVSKIAEAVKNMLMPSNLRFPSNTPKEGEEPTDVSVSDYVKVTSWFNNGSDDASVTKTMMGTICVTCVVPKLHDPYELVQKYLDKALKSSTGSVDVILTHTVTTDAEVSMKDLVAARLALSKTNNRTAYSYKQLAGNPDGFIWVPSDEATLEAALLPTNGVLYYTRVRPTTLKAAD